MATYISILRGINVSGKKKILMADLRALYESLGFTNVRTYIQSGNVIFESNTKESDAAKVQKIATAITEKYGFEVPIMLRTAAEFEAVINTNPFFKEDNVDPKKLYITFLAERPTAENLAKLADVNYPPDQFQLIGKTIFLYCEKYGRTKLSNTFFERKLKVTATTRNWKTVNKLFALAMG